jgi:hypothetical protein
MSQVAKNNILNNLAFLELWAGECNGDAAKAMRKLRPELDDKTARVYGFRELQSIAPRTLVLAALNNRKSNLLTLIDRLAVIAGGGDNIPAAASAKACDVLWDMHKEGMGLTDKGKSTDSGGQRMNWDEALRHDSEHEANISEAEVIA